MTKDNVTTADILAFMQEHMATKQDLAKQKHEILDVVDRKFEQMEQKMDKKFANFEKRMDAKFVDIDKRFVDIDKRFLDIDKRFVDMDKRFDNLEKKLDFKFNTLTDVLRDKNIIDASEANHLKTLKPLLLKN